jgi:exosortase/archaeosortase family protein
VWIGRRSAEARLAVPSQPVLSPAATPRPADRASVSPLRFALTFALVATAGLALYFFPYPPGSRARALLDAYLSGYAHVVAAVLRALGSDSVVVSGQDIVGRTTLRIVRTCDAADVIILLVSAIAAWPAASPRRRLQAACLSVAALSLLNVTRICTLYFTGAPRWLHIEVWPALMIAAAGLLFFGLLLRRPAIGDRS